jgi:hypothetical protein
VAGENCKKNLPVAHGPCGALRVNFQIWKILPPIQKCLNFFAYSIFLKKFLPIQFF